MFLFDILIYVMFAWVMCWFAKTANNYGEGSLGSKYYIWYFMLFYTIICGIRYNVGVDCLSYIQQFKTGRIAESRLEEALWVLLVQSIHRAGIHYTVGMGLVALAQIFFIVRALKGSYYILDNLKVNGKCAYTFVFNNDHLAGNFQHGVELAFGVTYNLNSSRFVHQIFK